MTLKFKCLSAHFLLWMTLSFFGPKWQGMEGPFLPSNMCTPVFSGNTDWISLLLLLFTFSFAFNFYHHYISVNFSELAETEINFWLFSMISIITVSVYLIIKFGNSKLLK